MYWVCRQGRLNARAYAWTFNQQNNHENNERVHIYECTVHNHYKNYNNSRYHSSDTTLLSSKLTTVLGYCITESQDINTDQSNPLTPLILEDLYWHKNRGKKLHNSPWLLISNWICGGARNNFNNIFDFVKHAYRKWRLTWLEFNYPYFS